MADTFSSPFAKAKDEYRPKRRTANGLVNRPPLPEQTARTSPPTFLFPYSLVKERFADIETTQPSWVRQFRVIWEVDTFEPRPVSSDINGQRFISSGYFA